MSYSQWAGIGANHDQGSTQSDPKLDSNYKPQTGSSAIQLGQNLTSLCTGNLAPLCFDKNGNTRPTTGNWDAGAYQFGAGVAPPANLKAAVN